MDTLFKQILVLFVLVLLVVVLLGVYIAARVFGG